MRFNAIAALGSAGASGHEVIQSLADVLCAPTMDSGLRGIAAVKLAQLGPAAEPVLIESLHHPDGVIRTKAADSLRQGRFDRTLAIPHLIQLLDDTEEDVRSSAAGSLEQIGPRAEPYLERAMQAKAGHGACYAARAFSTEGPIISRQSARLSLSLKIAIRPSGATPPGSSSTQAPTADPRFNASYRPSGTKTRRFGRSLPGRWAASAFHLAGRSPPLLIR